MKEYELFYIIAGGVSEDKHADANTAIKKLITEQKGEVTKEEPWGRKKLAYPILNEKHGFYFLIHFKIEGALLLDFEKLKLLPEILRYMITDKVEISDKEILMQKRAAEDNQKRAEARKAPSQRESKPKPTPTPTKPKVSLDDLDKKLDEILDKDIVS